MFDIGKAICVDPIRFIVMRKENFLLGVVSIFLVTLFSCSKDNSDNIKLLKKLVETSSDGTSNTTLYAYKGNEIVTMDSEQQHVDYTYTNGLITKIITKTKLSQSSTSLEFTYDKDKLVRINSSDNYFIKFIHNSDETVSYQKTSLNTNNEEVKLYHGVLSFKNKNLIKDKRTLDDTEPGVTSNYDISYEYDLKKNSFYNILGFDKLLNQNDLISLNNSLISVVESSVTNAEDQITSSANFYKSAFKYDKEGYPTEKVSESVMPSDGKSGYLKTKYFYE
tara:strand:- start:3806 stop:4642 length:837 start_codon:yes stop_codon:yes gene_type:complete